MVWKVYNIESGKILKAGFESEDDAKDWLEERADDLSDEFTVEEMDSDEIEEWREANEDEEEVSAKAVEEDDEDDDEYEASDDEESDEESLDDLYDDEDDDDL